MNEDGRDGSNLIFLVPAFLFVGAVIFVKIREKKKRQEIQERQQHHHQSIDAAPPIFFLDDAPPISMVPDAAPPLSMVLDDAPPLSKPRVIVICDVCQTQGSRTEMLKCSSCDPSFDICWDCHNTTNIHSHHIFHNLLATLEDGVFQEEEVIRPMATDEDNLESPVGQEQEEEMLRVALELSLQMNNDEVATSTAFTAAGFREAQQDATTQEETDHTRQALRASGNLAKSQDKVDRATASLKLSHDHNDDKLTDSKSASNLMYSNGKDAMESESLQSMDNGPNSETNLFSQQEKGQDLPSMTNRVEDCSPTTSRTSNASILEPLQGAEDDPTHVPTSIVSPQEQGISGIIEHMQEYSSEANETTDAESVAPGNVQAFDDKSQRCKRYHTGMSLNPIHQDENLQGLAFKMHYDGTLGESDIVLAGKAKLLETMLRYIRQVAGAARLTVKITLSAKSLGKLLRNKDLLSQWSGSWIPHQSLVVGSSSSSNNNPPLRLLPKVGTDNSSTCAYCLLAGKFGLAMRNARGFSIAVFDHEGVLDRMESLSSDATMEEIVANYPLLGSDLNNMATGQNGFEVR